MKQDVDQMRGGSAVAKELHVQHEGKPREGMPVARVSRCERPLDVCPRKAAEGVRVVEEIFVIVEVQEAVVPDGRINKKRGEGQQQTNQDRIGKLAVFAGGLKIHSGMKANDLMRCEQNCW